MYEWYFHGCVIFLGDMCFPDEVIFSISCNHTICQKLILCIILFTLCTIVYEDHVHRMFIKRLQIQNSNGLLTMGSNRENFWKFVLNFVVKFLNYFYLNIFIPHIKKWCLVSMKSVPKSMSDVILIFSC